MDKKLLKAAIDGDVKTMRGMLALDDDPALLLAPTAQGNTCLHIACIYGHKDLITEVLDRDARFLSVVNNDGETLLLTAAMSGHFDLATDLLSRYIEQNLNNAVLVQDTNGFNALHHAIRREDEDFTLKLIQDAPELSRAVSGNNESPMFIAVLRGSKKVVEELLKIEGSTDSGPRGYNALHAAIKYDEEDIVRMIMTERPGMAKEPDGAGETPMHLAAHYNRTNMLKEMLNCDWSLGYAISPKGIPLLVVSAFRGHHKFAEALLERCPDAPYWIKKEAVLESCPDAPNWIKKGRHTCLHEAVIHNRMEFVEFILGHKRLQNIVNIQDKDGNTALHLAVRECNSKIVSALLRHHEKSSCKIDVSANNSSACAAVWRLSEYKYYAKTMSWNKISNMLFDADKRAKTDIYNLHEEIKNKVIEETRKEIMPLAQGYINNTSLVAVLIATITFAAAFTLPGGLRDSSAGSEVGFPVMARRRAFQVFLISDTLAMCSSFVVAFISVIARWTDFEFLVKYRSITRKLMWIAYVATTLAFATGLYTVMAPRLHWLAITVCALLGLMPVVMMLWFREWFILGFKMRHSKVFNSGFLDMV